MSEREIARGRHSETEQMLSVVVGTDGSLTARPATGEDRQTFVDELPEAARDPAVVGRWRHFKGGEYEFCGLVATSPGGPLVLYLDEGGQVWLRPRAMIDEVIERDGRRSTRFERADV